MTKDEKQKIYAALAAPFPDEAIERSDGRITGRGYSTTGIRAQYIVNRLNEVLGVGGFRVERSITVKQVATSKGRDAFEAACEIKLQLGEWQSGAFFPFAEAVADGGHTAMTEADARKGASSNGFKKAAAFFGVGRQAYEGTIDDDNVPPEQPAKRQVEAETPRAASASPSPAQAPERSRLTSKQLNAIWVIAHKQGYSDTDFRAYCVESFGAQPEYLSRAFASQLIDRLGHSSNGHAERRSDEAV